MSLLLSLIVNVAAVAITGYLLSPHVILNGLYAAALTAIVLGVVNTFIKPIFMLLTLPLNIITLGLFSIIVNGLMIMIVSVVVSGFEVRGFIWAIIFSLVLSFIGSILRKITGA